MKARKSIQSFQSFEEQKEEINPFLELKNNQRLSSSAFGLPETQIN